MSRKKVGGSLAGAVAIGIEAKTSGAAARHTRQQASSGSLKRRNHIADLRHQAKGRKGQIVMPGFKHARKLAGIRRRLFESRHFGKGESAVLIGLVNLGGRKRMSRIGENDIGVRK